MKKRKISKIEKAILAMNRDGNYNSYECPEHGIYQIRKDLPEEKQVCVWCKKKFPALSKEEIDKLIKN